MGEYPIYLNINGNDYEVEILDVAGEEDFPNMVDMWIAFGEGFLLVFAINDYESFKFIKNYYERILKGKHGSKCPILLIGNKNDLEEERKVTYKEAKNQAAVWNIEYIETSYKNNFNYKESFEKLGEDIVKSRALKTRRASCCLIL